MYCPPNKGSREALPGGLGPQALTGPEGHKPLEPLADDDTTKDSQRAPQKGNLEGCYFDSNLLCPDMKIHHFNPLRLRSMEHLGIALIDSPQLVLALQ